MTAWKRTERAGAALLDAGRAPPAGPDPTDPTDEPKGDESP